MGENCSSSCKTRDHQTYGECLRDKGLRVGYCQSAKGLDATRSKSVENELQAYRDARRQGVQPAGTTMPKIRQAMELSEKAGKAYDASTGSFTDKGV